MAFLFRKRIRGKSITHPLGKSAPVQLEDSIQESIVIALREGVATVQQKTDLYMSHIRLAIWIASQYGYHAPSKIDDLVSEAFLAVQLAIEDAREKLIDNNFTAYCCGVIHSKIAAFVEGDHLTGIPRRTLSDKLSKGIKIRTVKILSLTRQDRREDDFAKQLEVEDRPGAKRYLKRKIRIEVSDGQRFRDLKEMISKSIRNEDERRVIELREMSYKDSDIAERLGISRLQVRALRIRVQHRFEQLETTE